MTSRYRQGSDFERKVRDHLLANGAVYVCRSAGSKGPVDLIAFMREDYGELHSSHWVEFVQAKRDGRITRADRWALCELAAQCSAFPVLARKGPRGTPVVLERVEMKAAA